MQSGCGNATASVGPFYCSADQSLYIDLSFFRDMRKTLGADGDFAYAYVIAHEVGHHVQHLLGTLDNAHAAMNRTNETEANNISVRIELQADFLAGVWAHHDNKMFNSIEDGAIGERWKPRRIDENRRRLSAKESERILGAGFLHSRHIRATLTVAKTWIVYGRHLTWRHLLYPLQQSLTSFPATLFIPPSTYFKES